MTFITQIPKSTWILMIGYMLIQSSVSFRLWFTRHGSHSLIFLRNKHKSAPTSAPSSFSRSSSAFSSSSFDSNTGDLLITALNERQDIMVKVVSCREIVQESILKNDLSKDAAEALGQVFVCNLMMGSSLKGDETLQINLVGDCGLRNVMAITDGDLRVRGMVGSPSSSISGSPFCSVGRFLGEGQVQVVRNHPSWKHPINGIVSLRDTSIALNMGFYMAESEQKSAVLLADVEVEGSLCRRALGIMVERLPGASEESVEKSVRNLEGIERKGLASYLSTSTDDEESENLLFRDFAVPLNKVIDDCLEGMFSEGGDLRWSKVPQYKCSCGHDKLLRALRLLPADEVQSLIDTNEAVDAKCEFCGKRYSLNAEQIRAENFK